LENLLKLSALVEAEMLGEVKKVVGKVEEAIRRKEDERLHIKAE